MKWSDLINPLLMALALLTRLPVIRWLPEKWSNKDQGRSVLWYPFVGVLLATLLFLFYSFLPQLISPLVGSVLIVTLWILLTGALHLDGLADSIDAACAAHIETEKKDRILAVFKDPAAGPMAVLGLIVILLLKVTLLAELISNGQRHLLLLFIIVLALPRTLALLLMMSTPYVSPKGLGSIVVSHIPKTAAALVIIAVVACLFFITSFSIFLMLILSLGSLLFFWRRFWMLRINGFVGDCVGALIELGEVMILLIFYMLSVL
ncbi:MAG: adenosylcobinamide-GDP ribazoletransferase [Cellvibrionaceae bacterium]